MDYVKIIKAMLLNSSAAISDILSIHLKCFCFFKENLRNIKEQNNHDNKTRPPYFSKGHIQF
jgi:hypothetical protein